MKKTMINQTHIEGVLYEHNLEAKVSGEASKNPGTPFIAGPTLFPSTSAMLPLLSVPASPTTPTPLFLIL